MRFLCVAHDSLAPSLLRGSWLLDQVLVLCKSAMGLKVWEGSPLRRQKISWLYLTVGQSHAIPYYTSPLKPSQHKIIKKNLWVYATTPPKPPPRVIMCVIDTRAATGHIQPTWAAQMAFRPSCSPCHRGHLEDCEAWYPGAKGVKRSETQQIQVKDRCFRL